MPRLRTQPDRPRPLPAGDGLRRLPVLAVPPASLVAPQMTTVSLLAASDLKRRRLAAALEGIVLFADTLAEPPDSNVSAYRVAQGLRTIISEGYASIPCCELHDKGSLCGPEDYCCDICGAREAQ